MIWDRMAGRPRQEIEVSPGADENGEPTVLRMVVVRPGDKVD